ncbi:MAG: hypothetical protein EOP90_10905 [Lysobacteraceae bacterium]|nr:MAG: hypothetical protein EOP90_10905 [Xanthomonadaceae bacterium]
MRRTKSLSILLLLLGSGVAGSALADAPNCASNGTLLSWPATDPIWEMCWLPPSQSVGPDGSGMELRQVHFKGHRVLNRAHAPMLFAEYNGSTCYRDWKDDNANFLSDNAVQNHLGISLDPQNATTSCDRSDKPLISYGNCPFQLPGYPNATADCFTGVAVEDGGDHVTLTTQHAAAWYQYTARWTFYADGRMEPEFGFGNNDGTGNETTHWHHNYWRMEFAIDNSVENVISIDNVDQTTEFSDLRDVTGGPGGGPVTWSVRNATTGNGYRFEPGPEDSLLAPNDSGRGFHNVDIMATRQHDNEYGDRSDNPLGACAMDDDVLVNGESLVGTNVGTAFYYHVSVRDTSNNEWPPGCSGGNCLPQDSMVCKRRGPTIVPFGPWVETEPTIPAANVSGGPIDVIVVEGQQATDSFALANTGDPGSSLDYTIDTATTSCATPVAVAWIGISPDAGSVAAGANAVIDVSVDAAALAQGNHSALVCVRSNDPQNSVIEVAVSVEVQPDLDMIFEDGFEAAP